MSQILILAALVLAWHCVTVPESDLLTGVALLLLMILCYRDGYLDAERDWGRTEP